MTYGYHQARSAQALAWLLSQEPRHAEPELPLILSCRAALLAAQRERCERAVRGANVHMALFDDRRRVRDIASLARGGAVALGRLLDEYPSFQSHAASFTDALLVEDPSPYSQGWLQAAKHAVLATETAVSSPDWTEDPGQAWLIMADIADSAEALTALDSRLEPACASRIPEWRGTLRVPAAQLRLAARHIALVARAEDFDPGTDAISRRNLVPRPIALTRFEQLPEGIKATERLLQRSALSVAELRSFSLMQSEIAHTCAELVRDPRLAPIRDSFARRDQHLRELAATTARVASPGRSTGRVVLAQVHEVGRVLLRARESNRRPHMGVIADCDEAQSRLCVTLAKQTTHAMATGRYLVVDDNDVALRWRRAGPGERPAVARAADQLSERRLRAVPADLDFSAQHLLAAERMSLGQELSPSADGARKTLRRRLDAIPYGRRPSTPNRQPSQRL